MKFEPHLAEGYSDREEMKAAAIQMRRDGKSRSQIAQALGFKTGGRSINEWLRDVPPPEWTKRPRAKDEARKTAVEMRLEGCSYREIREVLGVSKSTLSLWLEDVPLTEEQRVALAARKVEGQRKAVQTLITNRVAREEEIKRRAKAQVPAVSESELFVAGVIAYWAEGAKSKPWSPSQGVSFMNSDPGLVVLFMRWLRLVEIPSEDLTFRVSIHESADVNAAVAFWAEIVGVPKGHFYRSTLKRHNPRTKRRNIGREYHGCLTISVRKSTNLNRRIAGWFEGIMQSLATTDESEASTNVGH